MFLAKASSVLLFLMLILLLIYTFGKRYHLHFEIQRKLLHIALGLISLSFPFIFETIVDVVVLMIAALVVLLSLRYTPILRRTLGESIYGVNRSWFGGGLFVVSILVLFFLAHDNYVLYSGSLLTITFADAFAAIVGTKCGRKYYTIFGSNKSIEGTITFFVTAFVAIFLLLTFTTNHLFLFIGVTSVTVAALSTAAELFAGQDLDNLSVPATTFLVLQYLL